MQISFRSEIQSEARMPHQNRFFPVEISFDSKVQFSAQHETNDGEEKTKKSLGNAGKEENDGRNALTCIWKLLVSPKVRFEPHSKDP